MTATLDTKKIWTVLSADPAFANVPAPMRPAFQELIEAMPERLGDLPSQPLTAASFAAAKVAVLKASIEIGFVEKTVKKMPEEAFGFFSRDEMAEQMQGMLAMLLPVFEEIAKNTAAWLKENGADEEQFLAHPQGGRLNEASMQAYRAGTLTVGGLLERQPMAVILNTND